MPPIRALLERNALPTADLATAQLEFIVACEDSRLIGTGALQRFGEAALVRSVAVQQNRQGSGLGQLVVRALEQRARDAGVNDLVLLTQTARAFFERLGYRAIERAAAPAAVHASEEFRSLCPQSADCLSKRL